MHISHKIERLKKEASTNKVADAVFHVFALRERSRFQVTLRSLTQKMKAAGFEFTTSEYENILRLLVELEFGTPVLGRKGHVKAVKDIKTTLTSIGLAALGRDEKLIPFKQRNKFTPIIVPKPQVIKDVEKPIPNKVDTQVRLVVMVGGKPLNVQIPNDIDKDDLSLFIKKLM